MDKNLIQVNGVPQGLDATAYFLAKSIKSVESRGDPDPYTLGINGRQGGSSGEKGAYQFMPETWKTWAKQYVGDENAEMTIENQNKVAYSRIKDLLNKGYTLPQIASEWNSGDRNAYLGTFTTTTKTHKAGDLSRDSVIRNGKKFSWDVPGYTNAVKAAYNQYLKGVISPVTQSTASTIDTTATQQKVPQSSPYGKVGDFLGHVATGVGSDIVNVAHGIGNAFGLKPTGFGEKMLKSAEETDKGTVGKSIGKFAGYALPITAGLIGSGTILGSSGSALSSPLVKEVLKPYNFGKLDIYGKINAIADAAKGADTATRTLLQAAGRELEPLLRSAEGIGSWSELNPIKSAALKTTLKALKYLGIIGAAVLGGEAVTQAKNTVKGILGK